MSGIARNLPVNVREGLWRWRKNKPWRILLLPLFPLALVAGWLRRRGAPASSSGVSKVLILHFGAIGDALMTTPAIRLLNKCYPDAAIDLVAANRGALDVYSRNHRIKSARLLRQYDRGSIVERFAEADSLWRNRLRIFILYPDLVLQVLARDYDCGFALGPLVQGATFSNVLFDLVGIRVRVGCLGEHTECLTHKANGDVWRGHWVDFYREIVKAFAGEAETDDSLEFEISKSEREQALGFLDESGISTATSYAVIHPGGNLQVNSKRWGSDRFAEVADWIASSGTGVIITGSADEVPVARSVAQQMQTCAAIAAGALTLGETAALLSGAGLCVTNDTGILHLADAVCTPQIVSIFGPTDPRKIAPRNKRNAIMSSALECSPCIDFGAGDPAKRCWREIKEECLQTIPVEAVIAEIRSKKQTSAAN